MAEFEVKLDLGLDDLETVKDAVKSIKRQYNSLYKKGKANNNTVSNRDLHNLQRAITSASNQLASIKPKYQQASNEAKWYGNDQSFVKNINDLINDIEFGQKELDKLINSEGYQELSNFRVTSSRAFKDYNSSVKNTNATRHTRQLLSNDIKNLGNRASTLGQRWNKSVDTGSMTNSMYTRYQETQANLETTYKEAFQRYKSLENTYKKEYQFYKRRRDNINNQIAQGNGNDDYIRLRAEYDEALLNLEQSRIEYASLRNSLERINQTLHFTSEAINNKTSIQGGRQRANNLNNNSVNVLSDENTLSGMIRTHKRQIIRSSTLAGIANVTRSISIGNNAILSTYDNIKGASFSSNLSDKVIRNVLMKNDQGMDLSTASGYLNSYTSSQKDTNLSKKEIDRIVNRWGSLALNSGALDSTTNQLLLVAGLTAVGGISPKNVSRLADAIQNTIQNSGMDAKADEQLKALAQMYQVASTSGSLTSRDQRDIAGFQAMLAKEGGAMFQGKNGVQAYNGLANMSNIGNSNRYFARFWNSNEDFTGYTTGSNSYAIALEKAQRAKADPYLYKIPISNLYRENKQRYRTEEDTIEVTAQNLVEMSNGGLSFAQAKKLVELYAKGKFTRKNIRKYEKGDGKGNEKTSKKTGGKTLRSYKQAVERSEVKAANALTFFYKALNKLTRELPGLMFFGQVAGGATQVVMANVLSVFFQSNTSSKVFGKVLSKGGKYTKGIDNVARTIFSKAKSGSLGEATKTIFSGAKSKIANKDIKGTISNISLGSFKNGAINLGKSGRFRSYGKKGLGALGLLGAGTIGYNAFKRHKDKKDDYHNYTSDKYHYDEENVNNTVRVKRINLEANSIKLTGFDKDDKQILVSALKEQQLLKNGLSQSLLPLGTFPMQPDGTYGTLGNLNKRGINKDLKAWSKRTQNILNLDLKNKVEHKSLQHDEMKLIRHLRWWFNEIYKAAKNRGGKSSSGGSSDGSGPGGDWGVPIKGMTEANITSPFGPRGGSWHDGIDIGFGAGQTHDITAMHGGKVIKIDHEGMTQNDLGYYIIIRSDDGYEEIYQEFAFTEEQAKKAINVKVGDVVKTGQVIGKLIEDGVSITHIHVGVTKGKSVEESLPHSWDSSWDAWQDPAKLIFGGGSDKDKSDKHYLGGIDNHYLGAVKAFASGGSDYGVNYGRLDEPKSKDTTAEADLRAVRLQYSELHKPTIKSEPKTIRNAPKFNIRINTDDAVSYNKNDDIDNIINELVSNWITFNENKEILDYYAN